MMGRPATRRSRAVPKKSTSKPESLEVVEENTQQERKQKSTGAAARRAASRCDVSKVLATEIDGEEETQKQKRSARNGAKTQKKPPAKSKSAVPPEVEAAVDKFVQHVTDQGVEGLRKEFQNSAGYTPPEYVFEAFTKHKEKNRFPDVVCLDGTRVVLKCDYGNYTEADGDYVHANWVQLEHVERKFIAAQAPLPHTAEDFWRMVFQEQVAALVVMCKFVENGQPKCAEYWPVKQSGYANYGKMFVNNKKVETEDKFDSYTLEVLPDGCSNSLVTKLIHCTTWPDRGVPSSGRMVLRMLKMVKECGPGPVLVHCSAGIGRTGTILAIEAVNARLFKGKDTTVKEVMLELRNQRASCIQSEAQYLFVYTTVLDYIKAKLPQKYAQTVQRFYADLEKL